MKLIPALCLCMLIFSVACKKNSDHPNTPPPITDTTKPPKFLQVQLRGMILTYHHGNKS